MASYLNPYQTNVKLGDCDIEPVANGTHIYSHLNPPPRYGDYVAAQQRVANWVEQARNYQASDSMTTSSRNSEMTTTRSRTRHRSSARGGGSADQNHSEEREAGAGDLAGSYPSPPPSRRPVSASRSRTRASSSGTQRRRRRTRDEEPEVPPLPAGPIPGRTIPGANSAQSMLMTSTPAQSSDPVPALALLSSSLVVCALLPSILTVSVFVLFLTLASVRKQVRVQE